MGLSSWIFYSKAPKIAIELDGGVHCIEQNKMKDKNRDAYLAELGIYTLRFTNLDVLQNCENVLLEIKKNHHEINLLSV